MRFQVVFLARVVFVVFLAGVLRVVEDDVPDDLLLVELADLLDVRLDFWVDAFADKSSRAVESVRSSIDSPFGTETLILPC